MNIRAGKSGGAILADQINNCNDLPELSGAGIMLSGGKVFIMILSYCLVALTAAMPTQALPPPAVATTPVAQIAAPTSTILLPQDTPVELMAPTEVSTARAVAGTIFKLRVNRAIEVGGRIIVPIGTMAFGRVIDAVDSGGLGKSGRMTARLMHIQLGEAEIPLEGELSAKGTGAGSAGVAILLTGWAGFFHRGNNAKIKAGEILTGFVSQDVTLDLSNSVARRVETRAAEIPPAPVPVPAPVAAQSMP